MKAYKKILVAVDGSAASSKGLREAIRLAKAERSRIIVLHVVDEYPAFAVLDGMMAGAPGVDLVPWLREGGKGSKPSGCTTAVREVAMSQ